MKLADSVPLGRQLPVAASAPCIGLSVQPVMLKIEIEANGSGRIIRLIGRIRGENVPTLLDEIGKSEERTSLDLRDVTIVDLAIVRFLLGCEERGLNLLNCSLYIREWIAREKIPR